jgi:hypothetical protein
METKFYSKQKIYFEQNSNKFEIWTNFEFVQNSKHEQILNLFKIRNTNKIRIWTKFKFEQILIWTKFEFEQIWDMNKIENCSNPKFVQI